MRLRWALARVTRSILNALSVACGEASWRLEQWAGRARWLLAGEQVWRARHAESMGRIRKLSQEIDDAAREDREERHHELGTGGTA